MAKRKKTKKSPEPVTELHAGCTYCGGQMDPVPTCAIGGITLVNARTMHPECLYLASKERAVPISEIGNIMRIQMEKG